VALACKQPIALAIKIRWPAWATNGMTVAVNGAPQTIAGRPGSYVAVERTWQDGDRIDLRLPMTLRTEALPDDPNTVALLYGPIVLAEKLGGDNLTSNGCYAMSNASMLWTWAPEVPMFSGDVSILPAHIEPAPGKPLTFRSVGVGRPHDVSLIPYYRMHHQRFTVYWRVCTEAEWRDVAASRETAALKRKQIEPRIVDEILFGQRNEYAHKLQGKDWKSEAFQNRVWCESARGGCFEFAMNVKPDRPMSLQCTYWGDEKETTVELFTGKEYPSGPRAFDILVDDKKIAGRT